MPMRSIDGKICGIDLFAGAGGMSLGARLAGISIKYAIEIDAWAARTYSINHTETTVLATDIRRLKASEFRLTRNGSRGLVLFGGPPCQGFSCSNQRNRHGNNPGNWLFLEFLRFVRALKPDWVVFENVPGITSTEHGEFVLRIAEGLENLRYQISFQMLNAVDFGVAQNRKRFFIIGSTDKNALSAKLSSGTSYVTVAEAIEDLPELSNGANYNWLPYRASAISAYARTLRGHLRKSPNHLVTRNSDSIVCRYRHVPQGGNWEDIPRRLLKNYSNPSHCHTGIYHRLREDKPSVVIGNYRKNMLIHPWHDRGLSVREAARIQSFPDWYEFHGSIGFQQQQVGNAVPPLLAKAVFEELLRLN